MQMLTTKNPSGRQKANIFPVELAFVRRAIKLQEAKHSKDLRLKSVGISLNGPPSMFFIYLPNTSSKFDGVPPGVHSASNLRTGFTQKERKELAFKLSMASFG